MSFPNKLQKLVWRYKDDLAEGNTFVPANASWHTLIEKSGGVKVWFLSIYWDNDAHNSRQFSFELEIDGVTALGTQITLNGGTTYYLHVHPEFNLHGQTARCAFGPGHDNPSTAQHPLECGRIKLRATYDDAGAVGSNPIFMWSCHYQKLENCQ